MNINRETKQERIIVIAKSKGFESKLQKYSEQGVWGWSPGSKDGTDTYVYLWFCELQKWLMDTYHIFAYIDWYTFEYVFIEHGKGVIRESIPEITNDINDWEIWFEGLLFEALKIIK